MPLVAELTVATYNTHAGVDGWGRPQDVVGACRALDADVLVLQEAWRPHRGRGVADEVADTLGYRLWWLPMGTGRRRRPSHLDSPRWGPLVPGRLPVVWLRRHPPPAPSGQPGATGLAVLSRLEVKAVRRIDLGRLRRDPVRRMAIALRVVVDDAEVEVVGTHMSHITKGSPVQYRRLRAALAPDGVPAVVAGDMNQFGPVVVAMLGRRWRRAVRGRTWQAWWPVAQPDHILVTAPVTVVAGRVGPPSGSDHRPVVARLRVGPAPAQKRSQ